MGIGEQEALIALGSWALLTNPSLKGTRRKRRAP